MSRDLTTAWEAGYSIAELWGSSRPVMRATSDVRSIYPLLWGILSMAEYQIDRGAGHTYLRTRLEAGDWIAIGTPQNAASGAPLVEVPRISAAKFGKRRSAIGDGMTNYINVRIINKEMLDAA